MIFIHWVQHPVGHGGFHTGHLRESNATFDWAFDCGSRRTRKFDNYLRLWTQQQGKLDWLFISHFDTDHVSGLDALMSRTVVSEVMVPYLNERELAFVLLHEISRDTLIRPVVELTADPAAFFLSRGAARVTFLRGRRPEDDPDGRATDPEPREGERTWTQKINPRPTTLRAPRWASGAKGPSPVRVINGGACDITVTRAATGLRLMPYRAPVHPRAHRGLIKAIKALVGTTVIPLTLRPGLGALAYAVAHHARTPVGRSSLRLLFKTYAGSSNRASLSLLTEPILDDPSRAHWYLHRPAHLSHGSGLPAWLNTGDAELLTPADLADWRNCYASALPRVRALALPHHGSDKNSDAALQALCPSATLNVHANSKSGKHPGAGVMTSAGRRLARVTEDAGSEVRMTFHAL